MAATAPSKAFPAAEAAVRIGALRRQLAALEPGVAGECGALLALGNPFFDAALGGGLGSSALHEIAAARETDVAAASGFVLALAARMTSPRAPCRPRPSRAGSSARQRRAIPSDRTASVRRASSRAWCATVVVLSEHGSWSGTVWSSVSSSQRILSLWLERLSTDRIARQWREAPSPLVVFGKRGNLDLLLAIDAAAERLGLTVGLALAQARAMHPTLTAVPEDFAAA